MKARKQTYKATQNPEPISGLQKNVLRKRKFDGAKLIHQEEYCIIDKFLSNYKTMSKKGYTINEKMCSGEHIKGLLYDKSVHGSQYISGFVSDDEKRNQTNLNKLEGMLMDVVKILKYCRKILMPIHANFHWHLMVVSMDQRKFYDYNSLHLRTSDYEVERWSDWLGLYFLEKQLIPNMHDWDQVLVKDFPLQMESSIDCGVFLMKAIEYLALDNSFDFT